MTKKYKYIPVLSIAGSDSGGGAGIQADLKTFSALGCYGMCAITALTAQNTLGVRGIESVPPAFVKEQILAVLGDIPPAAIKIGMVYSPKLVEAITEALLLYPQIPVIFDPVMISTSGHRLIEEETVSCIVKNLFPLATLITPNMDEASLLAGIQISTVSHMQVAGEKIMATGCNAILLKGGHLASEELTSVLLRKNEEPLFFTSGKITTKNTHGSGCTLSSAIACFVAQGKTLQQAVGLAETYVHHAIQHGSAVTTGNGNGPLNHFFYPQKMIINEVE